VHKVYTGILLMCACVYGISAGNWRPLAFRCVSVAKMKRGKPHLHTGSGAHVPVCFCCCSFYSFASASIVPPLFLTTPLPFLPLRHSRSDLPQKQEEKQNTH
jgi:hypothetical protein